MPLAVMTSCPDFIAQMRRGFDRELLGRVVWQDDCPASYLRVDDGLGAAGQLGRAVSTWANQATRGAPAFGDVAGRVAST